MHATAAKSLPLCPTLCDPSRWLPTRLHCPWDSPGQNTGVGCHFLLQGMKVKNESEVTQRPHGLQPTRLLHPRDFPGKSTGVGCHCLLRVSPKWKILWVWELGDRSSGDPITSLPFPVPTTLSSANSLHLSPVGHQQGTFCVCLLCVVLGCV